jgi:hypothetical protein
MATDDLTVDRVREQVAYIAAIRQDDEVAHSEEDRLYRDVLKHIANGGPDAALLALEALKVEDIEFFRWCA